MIYYLFHINPHSYRALLDSGRQFNFSTADPADILGIQKIPIDMTVNWTVIPITKVSSTKKFKVDVLIRSMHNAFLAPLLCLVVSNISDSIPNT